jgi:hypothetical protein
VRDRPRANTAPLARSPCRGDRFPRSMQEPRPRSRHLHAGHHLANQQAPARLIPGLQSIPGFDVNLFLRHVISGSLALAFVIHTCRAQRHDFPPTLTTTALDRSSSGWFAASACTAAAEGHQDTNARLLHLLRSTVFSGLVFYIQPPSTFVAHLWTIRESPGGVTRDACRSSRAASAMPVTRFPLIPRRVTTAYRPAPCAERRVSHTGTDNSTLDALRCSRGLAW